MFLWAAQQLPHQPEMLQEEFCQVLKKKLFVKSACPKLIFTLVFAFGMSGVESGGRLMGLCVFCFNSQ